MTRAEISKARREQLKAEGLCFNARSHGPAVCGVRCLLCKIQHEMSR